MRAVAEKVRENEHIFLEKFFFKKSIPIDVLKKYKKRDNTDCELKSSLKK